MVTWLFCVWDRGEVEYHGREYVEERSWSPHCGQEAVWELGEQEGDENRISPSRA
jgi:hypothetical protein